VPYPFESLALRARRKGDAKDAAQGRCGLNARNGCERVPAAVHLPLRHNRAGLAFGDGTGRHHADAAEEKDLERSGQAQPAPFAAPALPARAAWRYYGWAAFDAPPRPEANSWQRV